jgi:hypothetical protein
MVLEGVVRNRAVAYPPEADLPGGTIVCIEAAPLRRFTDLVALAGTWDGDDADRVVAETYSLRSNGPPGPLLGLRSCSPRACEG